MELPLNAWLLFANAAGHHRRSQVVSRLPDGARHRATYAEITDRSQQLMHALDELAIERGERVATLAWNSHRHLEAYFAVPCSGRVLHTLNVRLSVEELAFIMNDGDDRAVLVDPDFVPLLEQLTPLVPGLRHVIVLEEAAGGLAGAATLPNAASYEDLIAEQPSHYPRPHIDEHTPLGLCYTSGTTGQPKGALYTHRSTFLHALAVTSTAGMAIGSGDCVLAQVPMFHANAWGMPYAATAVGAKQVFYAGPLESKSFVDLLLEESVTIAAGVPTIWIGVAEELSARDQRPALRHIVSGGAQPPRSLIDRYRQEFGVPIIQAWGMTEMSPLASMAWPQERMRTWDDDAVTTAARTQAGLPIPGVEVSIRDEEGKDVPFDGEAMGTLHVRGPWVIDSYLHGRGVEQFTEDGWFNTGDIAIGSPDGYFVIADRSKDLIKSGGEWISSVDMEAAIMAMPQVLEAAVIAVPDQKWLERPLACVVAREGETLSVDDVRSHLEARGFARWQLPDRVELVDEVPKTSVGKFDKKVLRARFAST